MTKIIKKAYSYSNNESGVSFFNVYEMDISKTAPETPKPTVKPGSTAGPQKPAGSKQSSGGEYGV
ncbi:hypothetical protein [Paenibacillus sp. FSL K6-2393]|uniref:hypothetical protein n=1 Tax=Paenibacillus sp. FSL K6-2393 TaxID=2921475 RepID=UPI0010D9611F|nr:hypothetical protein E2R58_14745 [Paenibacillus amylolyticus]